MQGELCDVLVVGAGVAGVAAAVKAARRGGKTILVERNNFLGGEVISGMHAHLCGLYLNEVLSLSNNGIAREVTEKLLKVGAYAEPMGKVNVLRFNALDLIGALKTIAQHKNLKVYYQSYAQTTMVKNNIITGVKVKLKNKDAQIIPRVVIDASGAIMKNIPRAVLKNNGPQPLGGYAFKIKVGAWDQFSGVKIGYVLTQAVKQKKFPWYYRFTYTAQLDRQTVIIKLGMPCTPANYKYAVFHARRVFDYLKKTLPELRLTKILKYGTLLERAGARLNGKIILSAVDVTQGKKYHSDVAAHGAWPMEFWGKNGVEYIYPQRNYYDIPAGCLKSKTINNLLAAGRFISADVKALASARVAGICLATGDAAGNLAYEYLSNH